MTERQKQFLKNDLFYELRMLLGASKMASLSSERKLGNLENYFKDSAYLHIRNLYNFFSECSIHDARVHEFVDCDFDLQLYKKWKGPLHNHVLHIKDTRTRANNIKSGGHLNKMVQTFTEDIKNLWQDWIEATADKTEKELLQSLLLKAQEQADDDYNNSTLIIKER